MIYFLLKNMHKLHFFINGIDNTFYYEYIIYMNHENLKFEKFSGYGSKISRKISITKSCSFGIPPTFFKENNIDQFTHVVLFFDKDAGVIGLQFNNSEEGFKLIKYGSGERRGASFVARSFFNAYRLEATKYKGRYNAEKIQKDNIGELYIIDVGKRE